MKKAIQKAVKQGLSAVSSLNPALTYHSTGIFKKNPVTSQTTEIGGLDHTGIKDITLVQYKEREIDGTHVLSTDQKGIWAQLGCPVTPKDSDYIMNGSERWNVHVLSQDPAAAAWFLQLRRP